MNAIAPSTSMPPFCTIGPDRLPQGPRPGTPESVALAAWEVLTGARVSRSTGSGRMSLLGAHRAAGGQLTRDRAIWIALHAFEGSDERWACRLARGGAMDDHQVEQAIVQEMGGPPGEPDEMTTLGFWLGDVGFNFDCRGPSIEMMEWVPAAGSPVPRLRTRRVGRAALIAAARRLLRFGDAPVGATAAVAQGDQLSLL